MMGAPPASAATAESKHTMLRPRLLVGMISDKEQLLTSDLIVKRGVLPLQALDVGPQAAAAALVAEQLL